MFNKKLFCAALAACMMMTVPVFAEEETAGTAAAAEEITEGEKTVPESEVEIDGETVTIRLKATGDEKMDKGWGLYTGDKGDASLLELLTQSDQEEGYAYVGSFRALEDNGDDTIYIVQTDGKVVDQYQQFTFAIEDGKVKEQTGGGIAYPVNYDEVLEALAGTWNQKDGGELSMEFLPDDTKGIKATVFKGDEGYYSMTLLYDAMKDTFVYDNGFYQGEDADPDADPEKTESGYVAVMENDGTTSIEWTCDSLKDGTVTFEPMK